MENFHQTIFKHNSSKCFLIWFTASHAHTNQSLAQIEWLNGCFSLFIDCCSVYWAVLDSWGTLKTKKHLWMDGEYVTWHGPCEKRHTPLGRSSTTKPCCPSVVQTPPRRHKTEQVWMILAVYCQHPIYTSDSNNKEKIPICQPATLLITHYWQCKQQWIL